MIITEGKLLPKISSGKDYAKEIRLVQYNWVIRIVVTEIRKNEKNN
jgi:hypothetical protein